MTLELTQMTTPLVLWDLFVVFALVDLSSEEAKGELGRNQGSHIPNRVNESLVSPHVPHRYLKQR